MIKRHVAAALAFLVVALPACDDSDWLTEVPQDFIGPENFFRNADDAIAAVNGVYAGFVSPLNCGSDDYYGRNFIMLVEYPGEAVTSRYGATHDRGGIDALNITTEHPYLATTWLCAYSAIGSANLVIANVPNIAGMDAALRDRVVGEARFLRAIHYFNLVRLFGDVPLRLEPVSEVGNLTLPRTPAVEVYRAILSDLEFAAQKLPATYAGVPGVNTGRATSGAARALLAKVHLQYGAVHGGGTASFQAAADQARQVVQGGRYRLLPDFARIFALDNEMNTEVVFAVQLTRVSGLGGRLAQHVAPIGSGLSGVQPGGISFYPEWPFYRDWSNQDRRKAGTVLTEYVHPTRGRLVWTRPMTGTNAQITTFLNNFGTPGGGPFFAKYLDPQATTGAGDENDIILIRYADVLLMLAEAINEASGPTAEAYAAANAVRNRAGLANLPAGLSQQQFREAVQVERRYEFVLEGHVYFDMQRHWSWSKARVEAHLRMGLPTAQGGQNLNASPWSNSVPKIGLSGGVVEDRYRFFPIPASARATNPELTQNPGW
ncbi:MAG TPA: RagB/SusD family nutrient uptake outer membrane protein [Longimicrobiaceae bacterium]|nr:RagB/SusD family nutrient uptake outer membrane protein [Longimicrobiaceae bacterium]